MQSGRETGSGQDLASRNDRTRMWIILGSDGRSVIVGRHSDPTAEELTRAGEALAAQGLSGWLAVQEGRYYARRAKINLMKVRTLTAREGDWETAVHAYRDLRATLLESDRD
jgi:hypothetical protein